MGSVKILTPNEAAQYTQAGIQQKQNPRSPGFFIKQDQLFLGEVCNLFGERQDALLAGGGGTGRFFEEQLTYVQQQVYRAMVPKRNAFALIPPNNEYPAGAEGFKVRMYESTGRAKWIGNNVTDIPRVSTEGSEDFERFHTMAVSFCHTWQELQASAMARTNLSIEDGISAREAMEILMNDAAWFGEPSLGINGALNHPLIPRIITTSAFDSGTSADTIIATLNLIANQPNFNSLSTHAPTDMGLCTEDYSYIATTPRATTADTTILKFFIDNHPTIERVHSVHEFSQAGPGGVNLCFVWAPMLQYVNRPVAVPFTMLPSQRMGLGYETICLARCAGIKTNYPLSMVVGEIPVS